MNNRLLVEHPFCSMPAKNSIHKKWMNWCLHTSDLHAHRHYTACIFHLNRNMFVHGQTNQFCTDFLSFSFCFHKLADTYNIVYNCLRISTPKVSLLSLRELIRYATLCLLFSMLYVSCIYYTVMHAYIYDWKNMSFSIYCWSSRTFMFIFIGVEINAMQALFNNTNRCVFLLIHLHMWLVHQSKIFQKIIPNFGKTEIAHYVKNSFSHSRIIWILLCTTIAQLCPSSNWTAQHSWRVNNWLNNLFCEQFTETYLPTHTHIASNCQANSFHCDTHTHTHAHRSAYLEGHIKLM